VTEINQERERDDEAVNFAVRMNHDLKVRGWKRSDLARKSGLDYAYVNPIAHGDTVYLGRAAKIAAVLGRTLDEMIQPWGCGTCNGQPPAGFTCNSCGTEGERK
jgi:transcriptional regulator with XRE-family HTH domain